MSKGVRLPWMVANQLANKILELIPVFNKMIGGSIIRQKDTVGDIDIAVVPEKHEVDELEHWLYCNLGSFKNGNPKNIGKVNIDGYEISLNVFVGNPLCPGAVQVFCIGSGDFNIYMRWLAKSKGMLLNNEGLFRDGERVFDVYTELDIFKALGIEYIDPCKRIKQW